MSNSTPTNEFAPSDPTDDRKQFEWRSRYPEREAQLGIIFDGAYLGAILLLLVVALFSVWIGLLKGVLHIANDEYPTFQVYGFAWLGGTLGGVLFSLKWLYHSVARGWWNEDRHLWRMFTPHISGGLAFAVIALMTSGLLRAFDAAAIRSSFATVIGIAFLVGYFSDSAIAKLSELADTLFGAVRPGRRRSARSDDVQPPSA